MTIKGSEFGHVVQAVLSTLDRRPNERFKVTVYILDRALRSDGIRANVFRQTRSNAGDWRDAAVDESLGKDLENTILTRARQIRIQQASQ